MTADIVTYGDIRVNTDLSLAVTTATQTMSRMVAISKTPDVREVGRRLMLARKALGLTQQSASEACGVARNRWAQWETGKRTPNTLELVRFCDLFDVPLDYIFRGKLGQLSEPVRDKVVAARGSAG